MIKKALFALLPILAATSGIPIEAAVDITVNQKGRLTSVGNDFTRTFQQYDVNGRLVATQHVQDGQSRTFKTAYGYPQNPESTPGQGVVVLSQTFPDGEQVAYAYDLAAKQVTVRSVLGVTSQDIVRDVQHNARGQLTRLELGNGVVTTLAYDEPGHLRLIRSTAVNGSGQTVQDYTYTYDHNGNVTGMTDGVRGDQSATYEYDSLDQLITFRNSSGTVIEQYDYDQIGNLTQKGALVQTYGGGGRPHALASSGGVAYGYDANGNVTSIGGDTTIEWNAENMPKRVTAGAVVTDKSFVGESVWKKVEQGTTTYYLPSMRVENGIPRKYYGNFAERHEQAGDRQLRFYHPDHLGSSTVMTDSSGTVIRRASFFPWGQDRGVDGTFTPKLQFNNKEKDANGFYDYGARLYNPVTGRWLSPDTSTRDGLNRYAYVRNNPWTMVDPTGHDGETGYIWIFCRTPLLGAPLTLVLWPVGTSLPKGWSFLPMTDNHYEGEFAPTGRGVVYLSDGSYVLEGADGEWREGQYAGVRQAIGDRASLEGFARANQGRQEADSVMFGSHFANQNYSRDGFAAFYKDSSKLGGQFSKGAPGPEGVHKLGSSIAHDADKIRLWKLNPPNFIDPDAVTVIGSDEEVNSFAALRHVNRSSSVWSPSEQEKWFRKILSNNEPIIVLDPGNAYTQWQVNVLLQKGWSFRPVPDGMEFRPRPIVETLPPAPLKP